MKHADRDRGDTRSGNPNPHKARQAKARRRARNAADLGTAQRVSWTAVRECERVLLAAETDIETRLKAAHALNQCLSTFTKLTEAAELAARVEELERAFAEREKSGHLRRAI
jgi:hypothetical protein